MNRMTLKILPTSIALFLLLICPANSTKLTLRIEASNPADHSQTVNVRSYLPLSVQPSDITDLSGLALGYDIKKALYYVYGQVELVPNGAVLYQIELKDIWQIPADRLDDLQEHGAALRSLLRSSKKKERVAEIGNAITDTIEQIRIAQTKGDMKDAGVEGHVAAYSKNLGLLRNVKKDIVELEDLALSTGHDPDGLLKDPEPGEAPGAIVLGKDDFKNAVIKIMVTNPSPTEPRHIPVRHELPREIEPADVLSAGDLTVRTDAKSGVCYVYRDGVDIPPGGTIAWDVVIRDKWNVNDKRIGRLRSVVTGMLQGAEPWTKYKSTMSALEDLSHELDQIAVEKGPAQVNDKYVAFYRSQARDLDRIENMINRVNNAPCRVSGRGTSIQAPSRRTTWGIIYAILIFLAVMSVSVMLKSRRTSPF